MHPDFALHPTHPGPLIDDPAEQAGFTSWQQDAAGQRIAESHFALTGLYCAACADVIESALRAEPGVLGASVNYATRRASVRWHGALTRPSQIVAAVARAGYAAAPDLAEPARALRQRAWRDALWRLFVAAFCMMQVMMYAAPAYVAEPGTLAPDLLRLLQWASWLLSLPVVLFSAAPIFREAWQGVLQRQVRMDLPVAIGIAVTFVASSVATFAPDAGLGHEVYFDSLTMFVFFLLGGRTLALRAQGRVAASLEAALARQPQAVRRVEADGSVTLVALRALGVGDLVRVLVGEAFPADGCVTEGETRADEALLTGESRPVPKQPGDTAIAGSLNLGAPVTLRVERLGADTRYEAVVALMRSALTQRPALVRAADRVAVPFLWGVLAARGGGRRRVVVHRPGARGLGHGVGADRHLPVRAVAGRALGAAGGRRGAGAARRAGATARRARGAGRSANPVLRQDRHADRRPARTARRARAARGALRRARRAGLAGTGRHAGRVFVAPLVAGAGRARGTPCRWPRRRRRGAA